MEMNVALGKLKAPEGIDVIWLEDKAMKTDVALGKLNASEGIDEIWFWYK